MISAGFRSKCMICWYVLHICMFVHIIQPHFIICTSYACCQTAGKKMHRFSWAAKSLGCWDSRFCQDEGILFERSERWSPWDQLLYHSQMILRDRFHGSRDTLFSEVLTNESRLSLRKFLRFKAAWHLGGSFWLQFHPPTSKLYNWMKQDANYCSCSCSAFLGEEGGVAFVCVRSGGAAKLQALSFRGWGTGRYQDPKPPWDLLRGGIPCGIYEK